MATATSSVVAQEFIERGGYCEIPDSYFYVFRSRLAKDREEAAKGGVEKQFFYTQNPARIESDWWRTFSRVFAQVFCTATLAQKQDDDGRQLRNEETNCVGTPMVHVDIDLCKKFNLDGGPFMEELKKLVPASCYVRSSARGCQLYFKLDTPFIWHGDKKYWRDNIGEVFANVAYHLGGDPMVVRPQSLMRLPGSVNIKAEYKEAFLVTAEWTDAAYTREILEARFPCDPEVVPLGIQYAIFEAVEETGIMTGAGGRHPFIMALAGALRKGWQKPDGTGPGGKPRKRLGGINKKAALNLVQNLCKHFHDEDVSDRLTCVETTYRQGPEDPIGTLFGEWPECQRKIERIVHEWVELKQWYTKFHNIQWTPDLPPDAVELADSDADLNIKSVNNPHADVMSGIVDGVAFTTKDGQTFYVASEKDHGMFANFDLRITGHLIKADTFEDVLRGTLICGKRAIAIEIDAAATQTCNTMKTGIKGWPASAQVLRPKLWSHYMTWLAETAPDETISEVPFYGFRDIDKGRPTLLLPGENHDDYLWRGDVDGKDTADHGLWGKADNFDQIQEYLGELRDNLPGCHEDKYMYSALGWLCACPLSGFIREHFKSGFPMLMVSGLHGSGKSALLEGLSPHLGVGSVGTFAATTQASMRGFLSSNNLIPLILDEYRNNQIFKALALQDTFRDCWGASRMSKIGPGGSTQSAFFITPFALLGQVHITDEAALERTFSVRLNRQFMDSLNGNPELKAAGSEKLHWLNKHGHRGILGRALVKWIINHIDQIPDVLDLATKVCDKHIQGLKERPRICYISVVAGLILLAQVYQEYEVDSANLLSAKAFMPAILSADTELDHSKQRDTITLQDLFTLTDQGICNSKITGRNIIGYTYAFDRDNADKYAYFEAKRWYQLLQEYGKKASVTLQDEGSFMALLDDRIRQQDSPIIALGESWGQFRKNCVKVDLELVESQYNINVEAWNPVHDIPTEEQY